MIVALRINGEHEVPNKMVLKRWTSNWLSGSSGFDNRKNRVASRYDTEECFLDVGGHGIAITTESNKDGIEVIKKGRGEGV